MGAILPLDIFRLRQPKKCLVNQGSGLQYVARLLAHHVDVGQPTEFCVDAGNNFVERALIASTPVVKEQSQVVRGSACHSPSLLCQT
jgi:hypothetical protein